MKRNFTAIIRETLNIYKAKGSGTHKHPDKDLTESFEKTTEAAEKLIKLSKKVVSKSKVKSSELNLT